MYDELIAALRFCDGGECDGCCWYKKEQGAECYTLLRDAADAIEELSKPRWIPVADRLPESVDDDVLVTDGEGYAVGYWRSDAQAWDSTDFGWLENRSEPPCGIHTVTHWMPLPPLPEPPKEEAKNFCGDCYWHESEQQYCFRNGCHAYNESSCEYWEPMPADEPIPAEEET